MAKSSKVSADRQILVSAQQRGGLSVPFAFLRLSGPGWLQSAITLGGGSLTGALFLGVLGGTNMLWLQLVAITMGVIMLSAISYVTLSTGKRPFQAMNEFVNPVLGCGWLLASCAANMIWCMPQFSLSFDALDKNLIQGGLMPADASDSQAFQVKLGVSIVLFIAAFVLVIFNERQGILARIFDLFLKALIGMIVICFFGVVIYLIRDQGLPWKEILSGFIPDLTQWNRPTGKVAEILASAPNDFQTFWSEKIVKNQRDVMIGSAATAVGINMTFLLPYSMLTRGWDKPFRGIARFDLATGMAIPYVIVTSCVVIAASFSFHGKTDDAFLSSDPEVMATSPIFAGAADPLSARMVEEMGEDEWSALSESEQAAKYAALPEAEKLLASTLVKRNAFQLSQSLEPLLGVKWANYVFGLGVLGMGFSTIIILMLINGYVFRELAPKSFERPAHYLGCLVAGITGLCWPVIWTGDSQFWLAIMTSTFGMMLLPIAYIAFFFMMNSEELLGADKPYGSSLVIWNVLMLLSVAGATVAAGSAVWTKMSNPAAGPIIVAIAIFFGVMTLVGFAARPKNPA
jgi:Mn2+/Fe2+ NRAMP family transporter